MSNSQFNLTCAWAIPDAVKGVSSPDDCMLMGRFRDQTFGILVVHREQQVVVFSNAAAVDLLGFDNTEELTFEAVMKKLTAPGKTCDLSTASLRIGERIVTRRASVSKSGYCMIVLEDVTESERLQAMAESVNLMDNIGYIFSGIRHEIGNPINSIKMALTVLRENLGRFSREDTDKYLERSLAEIGRVEFLLRAFRNLSLFEEPDISTVDLQVFCHRLIELVREDFQRQGRGIDFRITISEKARFIRADPRALHQIMLNLLTNAFDALSEVEGPLIEITARAHGRRGRLCVLDNGTGIPEENLGRIFEPFFTTYAQGTGLGLLISRKMALKMGGNVSVENRRSKGAASVVTLPLAS